MQEFDQNQEFQPSPCLCSLAVLSLHVNAVDSNAINIKEFTWSGPGSYSVESNTGVGQRNMTFKPRPCGTNSRLLRIQFTMRIIQPRPPTVRPCRYFDCMWTVLQGLRREAVCRGLGHAVPNYVWPETRTYRPRKEPLPALARRASNRSHGVPPFSSAV